VSKLRSIAELRAFYGSIYLIKGLSHEIDFKNFDKNLQNYSRPK
jgi:hypothetical protein